MLQVLIVLQKVKFILGIKNDHLRGRFLISRLECWRLDEQLSQPPEQQLTIAERATRAAGFAGA